MSTVKAQCLIKHMENFTFTPLEVLNYFTEITNNSASQTELSTNTPLQIIIILTVTNGTSQLLWLCVLGMPITDTLGS